MEPKSELRANPSEKVTVGFIYDRNARKTAHTSNKIGATRVYVERTRADVKENELNVVLQAVERVLASGRVLMKSVSECLRKKLKFPVKI